MKVSLKCKVCGKVHQLEVDRKGWEDWTRHGRLIQHALPKLTPGQREFLMVKICEPCWDKMFPDE